MTATAADRRIRRATRDDTAALSEICLKTAASGDDASTLYGDPRLPGYVWSVPYLKFAPDFAFVLVEDGRTIGYVLAAPDTAAFAERLEQDWWPQVRRDIAGFEPTRPRDAEILERIARPESHADWLLAEYPAHLHINILPQAQSGGWGRRMIETELAALKAAGITGVHLGVAPDNERAKGFYRHLGFTDVSRDGHAIFAMRLTP
ncbi:GNAT family N-acetyltransferase [Mycobacterium sp. KBS0706]|uniref:GNAT family N-acetyltransferase n=1 Tax=Mycobacterium sp. KBS0706 TaxID=2578109 RepID=UPI00110FB6F2|nr:GNAT family N-acetyltransferase [Mycobacterium sp. KBS0706]TSD87610.1 GNAT family N-acetyltransferase [Mycobacterium sp. KBS0706]